MATKSTVTVGKSGYATGVKRTNEEWDKLFTSTILPALRGGSTMTAQRAKYGRSECIRMAARRAGYATIAAAIRGEKGLVPIRAKGVAPKVLVKRLADARNAGDSWNTLRLRTGLEADKLRTLLRDHGYEELATGRVVTSERGKAKAAKAAEAAKVAAKPARKPARKRAARKPKVTVPASK